MNDSNVNYNEECKLVLVVRTDLGMTKGMGGDYNDDYLLLLSYSNEVIGHEMINVR